MGEQFPNPKCLRSLKDEVLYIGRVDQLLVSGGREVGLLWGEGILEALEG